MLLDWKGIDKSKLASERVQSAPPQPFDELLSGDCRTDSPRLKANCRFSKQSCWQRLVNFIRNLLGLCADGYSISSLQQSIVAAHDHFRIHRDNNGKVLRASKDDIDQLLRTIKTEADIVRHFGGLNR